MISTKIKVEDHCQNCPYFEPVTDMTKLFADNNMVIREVVISCSHNTLCKRLKAYLERFCGDDEKCTDDLK